MNRIQNERRQEGLLVLLVIKVRKVLKEFFEYHANHNPQWSAIALSLAESILIVVDIDGNLGEVEMIDPDLIDELTRILHPVHRDPHSIEHSHSHHTVSIVSIREMYSGNKRGEHLASPECQSAEEWNIGIGFDDESGTQYHIESLIRVECLGEFVHISYIMLPISIECHEVFPTIFGYILSDIFEPRLECSSCSTIGNMMHEVDRSLLYEISE